MKRVFIAIDISNEARSKVAVYIDELRRSARDLRIGWERPEKLHLTLKFLGDVDDRQLRDVEEAVRRASTELRSFRSAISGAGRFPPKGDPRILWLGLDKQENFGNAARTVDKELSKFGFEPEKRKFHPHLTIARLREPYRSGALAAEHLSNAFQTDEFDVWEILIYESELLPTGSVYRKLASYPMIPT